MPKFGPPRWVGDWESTGVVPGADEVTRTEREAAAVGRTEV